MKTANLKSLLVTAILTTGIMGALLSAPAQLVINSNPIAGTNTADGVGTSFNSLYFFGHSWTAAGKCTLDPSRYWLNHVSNGPMWPEFVSTNLALPYLGANNYARCGATSSDILNQVANFSAPADPRSALYFLWAGGSEFVRGWPPDGFGLGYLNLTNEAAWNKLIDTAVANSSNAVNRLYNKGARTIFIHSQLDLSKFPEALRRFGTNTAGLSRFSEYMAAYNRQFQTVLDAWSKERADSHVVTLDIFTKLNDLIADSLRYGLIRPTIAALDDSSLTDKSFTGPGADYVFWDPFHGTSRLHNIVAGWTLEALTNSRPESVSASVNPRAISMHHLQIGRDYTLERSVDLKQWQDVQSFTAAAGTNRWDAAATEGTASFYRLKWSTNF